MRAHQNILLDRLRQWKLAQLVLLASLFLCSGAHASTVLCTAVADAASGKILQQQGGGCEERVTAASTFKVALSVMGYDAGYLTDERLPALPFKQGYADWLPEWRTTINPSTWISKSVVWYSQRLTEWLGRERLQHYVSAFHYGNEDLSGNPGKDDGLTQAWLSSSLRIAPLEEVGFLEKVVRRELSVAPRAYAMTSRITALGTVDGWEVHGKTGTGDTNARTYGWFVGWAKKGDRTLVFARLIQDSAQDERQEARAGLRARAAFLQELPSLFNSL